MAGAEPLGGADMTMCRHMCALCACLLPSEAPTPPGASAPILRDLSLSVGETDRLLVVGPSGCGKTSLLRMISGLWSGAGC